MVIRVASVYSGVDTIQDALEVMAEKLTHQLGVAIQVTLVAWCEKDPISQQVLSIKYPHARGCQDVAEVLEGAWSDISQMDILTGGFQCQPYSGAGDKLGDAHHAADGGVTMIDIASELQVTMVLMENVRWVKDDDVSIS